MLNGWTPLEAPPWASLASAQTFPPLQTPSTQELPHEFLPALQIRFVRSQLDNGHPPDAADAIAISSPPFSPSPVSAPAYPPPSFQRQPPQSYTAAQTTSTDPLVSGYLCAAVESAIWSDAVFSNADATLATPRYSIAQRGGMDSSLTLTSDHRPLAVRPFHRCSREADDFRPSQLRGELAIVEEEHQCDTIEVKPFVQKLFTLLASPTLSDVLSWNSAGNAFFIAHTERFLNKVLLPTFAHANIHSFTRQLNVYGFQRMSVAQLRIALNAPSAVANDFSGWSHPLFRRDKASNLALLTPRPSRARQLRRLEKQYSVESRSR